MSVHEAIQSSRNTLLGAEPQREEEIHYQEEEKSPRNFPLQQRHTRVKCINPVMGPWVHYIMEPWHRGRLMGDLRCVDRCLRHSPMTENVDLFRSWSRSSFFLSIGGCGSFVGVTSPFTQIDDAPRCDGGSSLSRHPW